MFYKYDLTRTVRYLSNLTQSLLYDVLYYQSQNVNTLLHNSSIAFSWAIALDGSTSPISIDQVPSRKNYSLLIRLTMIQNFTRSQKDHHVDQDHQLFQMSETNTEH